MDIKIQIIVVTAIITALIFLTNMVRKKQLELKYTLAWYIVGVGILVLTVFPIIITRLAAFMGVASPTNFLFFLGFVFSLIIIFTLTISVSRMSEKLKKLTQEIAIFEKNMEEYKQQTGSQESNDAK